MAIAIRSSVATRLSRSGPRIALSTKFSPPCPCVVTSRWFASAIWLSSSARFELTSSIAWVGMPGSLSRTLGQLTVGVTASVCVPPLVDVAPCPPPWS